MGYREHEAYYEDDAELWEEFEGETPEHMRQRFLRVMCSSYGVSIAAHVALLLILASIVIVTEAPPTIAKVITQKEQTHTFDPELKTALDEKPPIPLPEDETIDPKVQLDEPVVQEIPKGDPENSTDKNLNSDSLADAVGAGASGAAGAWGDPRAKRRDAFLSSGTGSPGYTQAPRAALYWLKRHQSPDGHWDAQGWEGQCKDGGCQGPGEAKGGSKYNAGITGLALLAYTGHGSTHRNGEFKTTVNNARRWLLKTQLADGSIGFREGAPHGGIYNHALATMALCELYGTTRDFTLKRSAQKAVDFCLRAQNPNLGWQYGVRDGKNDTSVTGWMVLALKAAKVAGLKVPDASFAGARRWFERATNSAGETGYMTPGGGSSMLNDNDGKFGAFPVMTAVSVVCRIFTGDRTSMKQGASLISAHEPRYEPRSVSYYYWYYGTYALYQVGGAKWKSWEKAMIKALVPNQRQGGCESGSWDPVGEWCVAGGRVYATAINALTLEIHYRYAREHAK